MISNLNDCTKIGDIKKKQCSKKRFYQYITGKDLFNLIKKYSNRCSEHLKKNLN